MSQCQRSILGGADLWHWYEQVVNNSERAKTIRGLLRELEQLRVQCNKRLLRRHELQEALDAIQTAAESALEPDSDAHRVFDRMQQESNRWWEGYAGEYVDASDGEHVDGLIATLTAVIKELDPDAGTPEELNADLIREIEALKHTMVAVSTGGPRIQNVNAEYQERRSRVAAELAKRNIQDSNPYDDLWDWYGKWSGGELTTYQSRRDYLSDLFAPVLQALRSPAVPVEARAFPEPTGWAKIDRSLSTARQRLPQANSELEFQQVGHACRETLIDLAQEVYDKDAHPPIDDVQPSDTDARRMLEAYIQQELAGSANEATRRHAKAALTLANDLTHRRTATFRDAALCAEATASVVNIIAIISGRRDPH